MQETIKAVSKQDYIKDHPRSKLGRELAANDWPDNQLINVIGGLIAPATKQSNLYRALQDSKLHDYCIGGHRWRGTEGFWIAVA